VSEKLPEDELLNLINDLKKKRNQYLGEQPGDNSAREKLTNKIERKSKPLVYSPKKL
jgi:hypothetical protein